MMENSWQGKCGSTLQSSSTSLASSSSQELRNQTVRNEGCYFYPTTDPYDSRFKVHGVMQDSLFPNNLNVTSQRLGHVSLGNSFLALLSGPPSLLQCDFKDESNSKLMSDSNSVFVNAVGSGNPLRFSGLPSEQDLQPGVEVCPTILSRAVGGYNCSSNSVLSNLQNSDLDTTVVRCLVPGTEKAKGSFSSGRDSHITLPANAVKACGTIVQTSLMRTMESSSSTSNQSTGFLHGCPRVFCLGTGGHLLISNTGLLGIVCSCHCFHMSVLKFCEHSGLFGISPGDAVRMDSGETIAQWRKLYFQKFAIRVPEDQSDWDWPEGLSASAGLVKSRATMPDNISHLVHSSEGLVRSGQLLDNGVQLKKLQSDQNLVIGSVQNKQKKGVQDNNIHLKSLIGTSQSNMNVASDTQTMHCAFSACSSVAKSVGSGLQDSCQSISAYVDSILKNRNSSISCPSMHDFRTITQNFDFSTFKNAQNGVLAGKNAAISSIDLKLGQPYQSSQNSKGSELSSLGSQLLETVVNPPKIHTDSQGKVERGQVHCFPSTRREQIKWNLGSSAFQISDVKDAARLENSRGNLAQNAVVSLTNFNMLPGNNVQMKANYNMLNGIEHVMSSVQYHEPHFAKSGLSNVGWKGGNDLERQLNIYDLHSHGQIDKGKGVNFVTDGCYLMKDTGKRLHREMDSPNSYAFFSEAHGNSCSSNQLSSVPLEAPNSRKLYNYSENIPSFGGVNGDCVGQRSLALSNESGITPPADPQGVPFATSTCMLDQTPGFGVNPHLHDDNLEMLALKQILELSKQQHAFPSLGLNKSEGRYEGVPSLFHSPADCSTRGEQRNGSGLSNNRDISEAAVRAGLSDTTNMNGCCDLSTLTQGISPNSNQIAMQCLLSSNRSRNEHLSTRYGRCAKNMAGSDECQNCCIATSTCFQRNYNCSDHVNSFDMTLDSRGENFPKVLREHAGVTNVDGFRIFGSKFPKNHIVPNDKIMSLEQRRKLNGESPNHNFSHVSQWRDVPSKVKGVSSEMHGDNSASFLDQRVYDRVQPTDTHMNGTMQIMDSSKEHEISNISSGCSAPAITQLSVELSNMDGFSADDGNTGCVSNLVVDEGSEIDKSWSSDDSRGSEEGAEYLSATCKTSLKESGSSKNLTHHSPRNLLDELKLINSLAWKRCRTHIQTGITLKNRDNLSKKINRSSKKGKRKRDCSFLVHNERVKCIPCAKGTQMLSSSSQRNATCSNQHNSENRLLVLSSKKSSRKRDLSKIYGDSEETLVFPTELIAGANKCEIPEVSAGKKFRRDCTSYVSRHSMMEEPTHDDTRATKKYNSVGAAESSFHQQLNICPRKSRPIVCGKYGELSNGGLVGGMSRPAKIVSLSKVLKSAKRGTLPKNSTSEFTKTNNDGTDACCDGFNHLKTDKESRSKNVAVCGKVKSYNSSEKLKNSCLSRNIKSAEELPKSETRHDNIRKDQGGCIKMKPKAKEIRKRSIYELTLNEKDSHPIPSKISKCLPEMREGEPLENVEDRKNGSCKNVTEKFPQEQTSLSLQDSESFCCVCGGSNKDEINYLLECSRCFIKVHQACYGVSKVPKGNWYCRPCRTSSRNIVCVLCGYGGGAMTRALKSRAIVKSLLRVWNIETDYSPENKLSSAKTSQKSPTRLNYSGSGCEEDTSFSMIQTVNSEPLASAVCKKDVPFHLEVVQNSLSPSKSKVQNSITAGLVDSTTKQWIHMVCGLWTSETRCPNVDTMSSFDVSGVSRPRADLVCSICSRPGGSCMKCRVINCSVQFHPWCAHQKGLLQSEVEGIDNENVGFYGRCVLHAKNPMCESDHEPEHWETDKEADKITCARTEGYKGRKRDGFWHNYYSQSKGKIGSLVPQEQLNAWIHINGQKSRIHGLPKIPASDIEHDCRKEYARYKQARSWKHLVVYKSGIHALGLYTSRFISRCEMVVEYVGEIVGLRVSDKRENEYQSGRKLQYKSACYFFRIDKEHVIDATRKGGIARFVNHSCLPNCVAKVISVKNEKKVVFFAERDIFPGEEITYDYHFNHEDEGKKIPCFCNSKNCRRYLN